MEKAAHVRGLNAGKLMAGGVLAENIVEHLGIVQRFGNNDAKASCAAR